jgi:hypothetical protein
MIEVKPRQPRFDMMTIGQAHEEEAIALDINSTAFLRPVHLQLHNPTFINYSNPRQNDYFPFYPSNPLPSIVLFKLWLNHSNNTFALPAQPLPLNIYFTPGQPTHNSLLSNPTPRPRHLRVLLSLGSCSNDIFSPKIL